MAAANPNTIVVINSGGPVLMPWLDQVKGVVEAWYPGQQDGNAIAAVLFGLVNPGGHLPVTFPTSASDTPTSTTQQFPGVASKVDYSEELNVGYRGYDAENITPLFPFGYGLSYTTFKFSNLHMSQQNIQNRWSDPEQPSCNCNGQPHPMVNVTATVTNTGNRAGSDVAQLYVADPASAGEPPRQLQGFQNVSLQPGQSTTVNFTLTGHALSYFDDAANGWVLPDGAFHVYVGDSSALANLPLQGEINVTQTVGARYATIDVPATMNPGNTSTVNATFVNDGDYTISQPKIGLVTPKGWTATELGTPPADVPAGQTVTAQFSVNVPVSAQLSTATLTARLKAAGTAGLIKASAQTSVPSAVTIAGVGKPLIPVGSTGTATVELTSNLSSTAQVTLTPNPPTGITAGATTVTVSPGQQAVKLPVAVGSTAAGGINRIQLSSTVAVNGTTYPLPSAEVAVSVPCSSLSACYGDNVGITDDSDTVPGNLGGASYSYSAQALAAAGLTSGQPFTAGGLSYTWPSATPGSPDNVLASGQTVSVTGSGSTLGFLGTGVVWQADHTISGTGTINYSDGTSQSFTITFPNWWGANNATPGNRLAATLAYNNSPPGGQKSKVSLYDAEVTLQPGKTVTSVTLADVSDTFQQGTNAIHIFSMAIGTVNPIDVTLPGKPVLVEGNAAPINLTVTSNLSTATTATVHLTPPGGWTVQPSDSELSLAADESKTVTVTVTPPAGSAGTAVLHAVVDAGGGTSSTVDLPVTVKAPINATVSCTLAQTNTCSGLAEDDFADGVTQPVTIGGETGRQTVEEVPNDLNMYFNVDDTVAHDGSFAATFAVEYYDGGTNSWNLQYDSTNPNGGAVSGAYTPAGSVTETGSGTWKTATFSVPDARFAGRENGGNDWRISSAATVTIHSVSVHIAEV